MRRVVPMHSVHICCFAEAEGRATVRGKEWRWEFSKEFGPIFLRKNGEPLTNQPVSSRHPVWKAFEDWYEATYGPLPHREERREIEAGLASGALVQVGRNVFPRSMLAGLPGSRPTAQEVGTAGGGSQETREPVEREAPSPSPSPVVVVQQDHKE